MTPTHPDKITSGIKRPWYDLELFLDVFWIVITCIPSMIIALYYNTIGTRPKKNVKGEIVLVTGSGQGLGREISLEFSRLGAELICVDLDTDKNQETVNMIRSGGGKARGYVCDVSDRKAIFKLAEKVGRVDILVNNAGMYPYKTLYNSTERELRVMIDVNMFSHFWTVQAFLPGMKERDHGHIVATASLAGLMSLGYMAAYSVSKAGVIALMDTLRQEMRMEKRENIKLTTICPYFIATRSEIRDFLKLRLRALEIDEATPIIMAGILEERDLFTVPNELLHASNIIRWATTDLWSRICNTFSIQLIDPEEDHLREELRHQRLATNMGHCILQE